MAEQPVLRSGGAAAGVETPLLTYCDDATGERVELSATALGEWSARAAGLLREGCGLGAGSRAAVLLPQWLLAQLSADAAVVVCANATPEARREHGAREGVTHGL